MSVVEFILSSFPWLFFEGWSIIESGVDARLFFGRLMAATTAAAPRIILRRDKYLDPSPESGDIPDSASFVCVGMFIAISSVALGSEIECLQIAFPGLSRTAQIGHLRVLELGSIPSSKLRLTRPGQRTSPLTQRRKFQLGSPTLQSR